MFFKPGCAVQAGSDPIAGAFHRARNGNIARLVRANKTQRALSAEISGIADEKKYQEKPN